MGGHGSVHVFAMSNKCPHITKSNQKSGTLAALLVAPRVRLWFPFWAPARRARLAAVFRAETVGQLLRRFRRLRRPSAVSDLHPAPPAPPSPRQCTRGRNVLPSCLEDRGRPDIAAQHSRAERDQKRRATGACSAAAGDGWPRRTLPGQRVRKSVGADANTITNATPHANANTNATREREHERHTRTRTRTPLANANTNATRERKHERHTRTRTPTRTPRRTQTRPRVRARKRRRTRR